MRGVISRFSAINSEGIERVLRSYQEDPTFHISFPEPGNYTITVTAGNVAKVEATASVTIQVLDSLSISNEDILSEIQSIK